MAERRMIAKSVIETDEFLDMPASAQSLYFHLTLRADDDGFISSPKGLMRSVCASEDDMKELVAKRFVISFKSGVVVIRHWRQHNTIQKDRYKQTGREEMSLLRLTESNVYELVESEERPGSAIALPQNTQTPRLFLSWYMSRFTC